MPIDGKVKWYNSSKGYGFIEREDGKKDVFVHSSQVQEAGFDYLNDGDEFSFDTQDGEKGPAAINLKKK